jgi:hypothetical protein
MKTTGPPVLCEFRHLVKSLGLSERMFFAPDAMPCVRHLEEAKRRISSNLAK